MRFDQTTVWLTVGIAEQQYEDRVQDPLVDGGQVQRDHGDEQRERPDLAQQGGPGELSPDLAYVGQDQHHDDY